MNALPSRLLAILVSVVLAAGCMQPVDDDPASGTTTDMMTTAAQNVKFTNNAALGPILTDGMGKTLYVFTNDEPNVTKCYEQCATTWPPFVTTASASGPADIRDDLGTVDRTDGKKQVAYRGLPLYYFNQDTSAGDAKGDGVGGIWFVVRQPPTNSEMLDDPGPYEATEENVTYFQDVKGHYAEPQGTNATTGIVMVHEWWGLNDHIRDMADLVASHGYRVIAVDLFHGNVATTQQEAQQQVGSLNQQEATQNMQAAADYLRGQGATQIVSLGWCFGGGQSLQLAISGEELVATVIYYGFLVTDQEKLDVIDWPVLGIFGEKDQAIPVANVRTFERALNNLTIENDIYVYPEVGHAFANPSGDAWAPEETQDAWKRTLAFLAKHAGTDDKM